MQRFARQGFAMVLGGLTLTGALQACGNTARDFSNRDGGSGASGSGAAGEASNSGASPSTGGEASDAGNPAVGGQSPNGGEASANPCGNGTKDPGEECDQGAANEAAAYGQDLCTAECKKAPFCGDGVRNGAEACDDHASGATALGSCNPECTGFYEKKLIRATSNRYPAGSLGGIVGADAKCELEFGKGWKALLVGGPRRATTTAFLGDDSKDWVIHKYTHYFSDYEDKLLWRTDDVALLGVRDGASLNLYADAFLGGGDYPWSGWGEGWVTLKDNEELHQGTCASWTSTTAGWGTFTLPSLAPSQSESCSTSSFFLCVEQ